MNADASCCLDKKALPIKCWPAPCVREASEYFMFASSGGDATPPTCNHSGPSLSSYECLRYLARLLESLFRMVLPKQRKCVVHISPFQRDIWPFEPITGPLFKLDAGRGRGQNEACVVLEHPIVQETRSL